MNFLILELNEFNYEILKKYSKKYNFKYIKKILKYNHSKTFTKDTYKGNNNQDGYLDPWSQWVSIHTLKKSKIHKIKNLGDVPKLRFKQYWELKKNLDFYIWGPMNASRRNSKNVKLFFPDPWVFSEKAYPNHLNKILNPIKKTIKNRGSDNVVKKSVDLISIFSVLKNYLSFSELFNIGLVTIVDYFKLKKNYIFFCNWEYLCLKILLRTIKNKKNYISVYFINCLAHVQHHYWKKNRYSKEIRYCLEYIDKMIREIYHHKNFKLVFINGLSQINSEKEKLCLYEQNDHSKLLKNLGIKFSKVEKLMTNDAYIFFKNKNETSKCEEVLNNIKFKNKKIFHVERIDSKKIFYKTNFINKVHSKDFIYLSDKKLKFLEYFSFITLRRGIHSHNGDILSEKNIFPKKIENHKIFSFIK